ncbi:molybdopterin converting factor subunit 1 [Deinococcus maricopensis]|uniref:Molybdopterin converting factor, subunit 1 n=1 Tax=Deinococcus maricopensis (strain DSM 21211 / LMG 22137 / NRRL B-23946 / LB-34) TaxID=709986 RepID=E8U2Z4_DEIML|nr:molybdopterin converting factor subunit 1 [Deinococcus maricopensis]ADV65732.1 molybdopterin converting factor, subunit 1 [Deinococcus maricopensis DSM 21211]
MHITVILFARLRREAGLETLHLELPPGATARDAAHAVETQHHLSLRGCMIAVNETYATPDTPLSDHDEVAFLPPVAGGAPDDTDDEVHVTAAPLALAEADAFLVRAPYGAQAYFVGTVRSPNQGQDILYIDYEAYAPMAERIMRDALKRARTRHDIGRAYIAHRVGRLKPGEASILIGVASAHRRVALEACDFLIEHLKVHIPVWKLEVTASGERWVDGQTPTTTL